MVSSVKFPYDVFEKKMKINDFVCSVNWLIYNFLNGLALKILNCWSMLQHKKFLSDIEDLNLTVSHSTFIVLIKELNIWKVSRWWEADGGCGCKE